MMSTHGSINIYNDPYGFAQPCLPHHTVRFVWRASALGSVDRLGHPYCKQGHHGLPRVLDRLHMMDASAAEVALRCPPVPPRTSDRVSSAGGSAMLMKWPGGIGREAGFATTRHVKGLSIFGAGRGDTWLVEAGRPLRLVLLLCAVVVGVVVGCWCWWWCCCRCRCRCCCCWCWCCCC